MAALAASAATLLALVPHLQPATSPAPAGSFSSPASAAADPLTPAVAQIAWRDPHQRIEAIVQFKPGVTPAAARELVRGTGGRVTAEIGLINALGVELRAGDAARLAERPGIHAVSLNAKVERHELEIKPRKLETSFNDSVRAPKVWYGERFGATGKGVGVAVLDTGIDGSLPDFALAKGSTKSRIVASAKMYPDSRDGDGYGHGTHIAGLIAGNGANRSDVLAGKYAGVAPEANLISVKVSDDAGEATLLDVIYGLQFIIDHKTHYGIRIANLSLNSTVAESYKTDPLDAAVEEAWFAGIVVVTASGNRGAEGDAVNYSPANDPYVISVGAVDDKGTKPVEDDALAEWSSRGKTQDGFDKPDVLAPGAHITSTLAQNSAIKDLCPECVRDGQYFQMGGTSMAAGVLSGVIALLLEEHPEWTPDEVKGAVENRQRQVPGVGAETAADKAMLAPTRLLRSNEGLTPNELIDPATGKIAFDRARWTRARWTETAEPLRARWTDASWSRARWTAAEEAEFAAAEADPSRARWTRARWTRARWTTSFSK